MRGSQCHYAKAIRRKVVPAVAPRARGMTRSLETVVFVKRVTTIWCREPTVFSPRTTRALNFVRLII